MSERTADRWWRGFKRSDECVYAGAMENMCFPDTGLTAEEKEAERRMIKRLVAMELTCSAEGLLAKAAKGPAWFITSTLGLCGFAWMASWWAD